MNPDDFDSISWSLDRNSDDGHNVVKKDCYIKPADELEPTETDAIPVLDATPAGLDVSLDLRSAPETVATDKAQKLTALIASGKSIPQAAREAGIPESMIRGNKHMADIVKAAIESGHLNAAVRKEFVRAGLNLTLANALEAGDGKLVIDAAKAIATDPDVQLNLPPQPGVIIDLGSLGELLKNITPPPGIEPPIDVEKD